MGKASPGVWGSGILNLGCRDQRSLVQGRDVKEHKMACRGITSQGGFKCHVTLLAVSLGGKYKLVLFVALLWIQIVLSAECNNFVSLTASNSDSIFHSKSLF